MPNRNPVDFVFEYENKARELDNICLVAAELRRRGYTVAFTNSWRYFTSPVMRRRARVCILSAAYNNATMQGFTRLVKSYEKIVDMMWEQVYAIGEKAKLGENALGGFYQSAKTTRHVCWGNVERNNLIDVYGVASDCARVCGYLPLDYYRSQFRPLTPDRQTLYAKFNLDPRKKTLLFVSSFSMVNLPKSEMELSGDMSTLRPLYEYTAQSQQILLQWFSQLLQTHPDLQLVYRPHPAEATSIDLLTMARTYPGFFCINAFPIRTWLLNCDGVLNWMSTSLIEMYASGKPTYIVRPLPCAEQYEFPIFHSAHFIERFTDLEQAIFSESPEFPVPEKSLLQYYDIQEKCAYERIADWLEETYHDTGYTGPFFPSTCPKATSSFSRIVQSLRDVKGYAVFLLRHSALALVAARIKIAGKHGNTAESQERLQQIRYYREKAKRDYANPSTIRAILRRIESVIGTR